MLHSTHMPTASPSDTAIFTQFLSILPTPSGASPGSAPAPAGTTARLAGARSRAGSERRCSAGPARRCPHSSPGMLITPSGGGGSPRPSPVLPALLPGRGERSGSAADKASWEWARTQRRSGLVASLPREGDTAQRQKVGKKKGHHTPPARIGARQRGELAVGVLRKVPSSERAPTPPRSSWEGWNARDCRAGPWLSLLPQSERRARSCSAASPGPGREDGLPKPRPVTLIF